jgi:adenylate cyclase
MPIRRRITLGQLFVLTTVGLAVLLGVLFSILLEGSRRSIIQAADDLRRSVGRRTQDAVERLLAPAQDAVLGLERALRSGAVDPDDPTALEAALFTAVLNAPDLDELTMTRARDRGFDDDGQLLLEDGGRWQLAVHRLRAGEGSRLVTRRIFSKGGIWRAEVRDRPRDGGFASAPLLPRDSEDCKDPTDHLTFQTTASRRLYGDLVWSDLHWSELGSADAATRRAVVTVMKAVDDGGGRFVGVVRAGLLTEQLDAIARLEVTDEADDPHRVFLTDDVGRLITRLDPSDPLEEQSDDSLRIAARRVPGEVQAALAHPVLASIGPDDLVGSGQAFVDGRKFLVTYLALPETQGWRVGIVAPEDFYLRNLAPTRRLLLLSAFAVMAAILLGGALTLRAVRRGLNEIVSATGRMRNFDFAPSDARSSFEDVSAVLTRLELAKTAMRAMGKYVPVDLVRLLYQTGREPVLGGELRVVSVLFTDIQGFTTLAERTGPNELAVILGRYLEVLTTAIHSTQGTIDKYIGDAIMAVWNTPTPCEGHALRACEAILRCREAEDTLFVSEEWHGRPALRTRFGLHQAEVIVGHFGSPDRLSFTALGDGVNLAARLESLNKQYGTTVLVSEAIVTEARGAYDFRLVDRVAVKGKSEGVKVYELLSRVEARVDRPDVRAYELALERYWARDFDRALALLEAVEGDGPSAVLAERARAMKSTPPPPEWDGIWVARTK